MAGKILFLIPLIVSFHGVIFAQEDECADSFDEGQSNLLTEECGPWEYKFVFEAYESNPLLPNLHGSSYYMTTNPSGPSCMSSELISVKPGSSFEIEYFVSNPDESTILQPCSFDLEGDKWGGGLIPMDNTGSWKTITLPREADPILSPSNIRIRLQCPQMRGAAFIAFGRIHIKGMNDEDCPIASPTTTEPSTTAMESTTDIPDSSTTTNDPTSTTEDLTTTSDDTTIVTTDPTSTTDDVTSTTEDLITTSDDTTIVMTDPTSTTDDVTSTTEDLTTTSDDTTIVTTDPTSTTDDVTSTTEDLTTTSDDTTIVMTDPTSTTDDVTSTTEDLTTTSDDTTIVTTDPTSTTDDVTSTTEDLTTTSDDSTLATDDSTSTTDDLTTTSDDTTPTLDVEIPTMSSESSTDTTTEDLIITTTDLPQDSPSNLDYRRRTLLAILLSFGAVNTLWMAILILYYIFKTPVDKTNPKKLEENMTLPRLQVQNTGSVTGSWITGIDLK